MDRMTFGRKPLNAQRPRVDRFVAPRESFPEMRRRIVWGTRFQPRTGDIWYTKYLRQKKYMNYLDKAFDLEPLRVQDSIIAEPQKQSWPCIPRKKSYLTSADSILDLPTYSYATFPELLDWSNDNILVAALGRNYHQWSWRTHSLISEGYTHKEIFCCKFDPRGQFLLLGTDCQMVEIHDNALSKSINTSYCRCMELHYCSITAIDWSPTGNSYVTGCSQGAVCSVTREAEVIRWQERAVAGAVLVVRVSPDARFVAAAAVSGRTVVIMTWPTLQMYATSTSDRLTTALTWHPWRSALLGIGSVSASMHTRVTLWDAPAKKVQKSILGHGHYSLDAMLFSHRTGELVVSLWNSDTAISFPKSSSQLVVMSDCDTVVDQWGEGGNGLDRIRTMVFSPDGTKLATATADEDLIIWNFLPEDKTKIKKTCRRFSAMPVYLDKASYNVSLR